MAQSGQDADETLPFDVEIERLPSWVHAASGAVVVVGILVATKIISMLAFLPFLVASSVGRRFASSAVHVEIDAEGLTLGDQELPRSQVHDVWLDDDGADPRVTVAHGEKMELAILHFENREQARRFAGALDGPLVVAGHRPRPVDALPSLRFAAIGAAFFGAGSWFGLLIVALFGMGALAFARAKQVIARSDRFEIRTAFGIQAHPYSEVSSVDLDTGVIGLSGDREVSIPRSSLRDRMLNSPEWLERARQRVLKEIQTRHRKTPKGDAPIA